MTFVYLYSMQLFNAEPIIFSKNIYIIYIHFFTDENFKKGASKVAHDRPNPIFFIAQPTAQSKIDFSFHKYVHRPICLLICGSAELPRKLVHFQDNGLEIIRIIDIYFFFEARSELI